MALFYFVILTYQFEKFSIKVSLEVFFLYLVLQGYYYYCEDLQNLPENNVSLNPWYVSKKNCPH